MVNAFRWMVFVIGLAVVIGSIMVTSAGDAIITINSPSDDDMVNTKTITVSGAVVGDQGAVIKSVTVNGDLALGTGPEGGFSSWEIKISLREGQKNKITVEATDIFDHKTPKTITVYYQAPITLPTQPPRDHEAPSATPTPTPPPTVSISITSIPSGANVWLDDSYKGTTPIRENVTKGHHTIKVTKEGYDIYSETKKIRFRDGEPEEIFIELKPLTSSIAVFSTPSGASVYLDDVYKRDTNCMLSGVAVGPHNITLKKSGYFDRNKPVFVSADRPLSLNVTLTRYAYINISSNPPRANVYLDSSDTGETTPANISKVALGNRIIKLTKFGYSNNETKVDVSVAKTYHVNVNLSGGYGYIDIDSDPDGASVYLDGKYTRKKTPTNISKVVGNYSIRLRKSEYEDATQDIPVSAGKATLVRVELSPTLWMRINSPVMLLIALLTSLIAIIEFIWLVRHYKN